MRNRSGKLGCKSKIVRSYWSPSFCHERIGWSIEGRINFNKIKDLAIILEEFLSLQVCWVDRNVQAMRRMTSQSSLRRLTTVPSTRWWYHGYAIRSSEWKEWIYNFLSTNGRMRHWYCLLNLSNNHPITSLKQYRILLDW
jgi:hypothetical protein